MRNAFNTTTSVVSLHHFASVISAGATEVPRRFVSVRPARRALQVVALATFALLAACEGNSPASDDVTVDAGDATR